MKKNLKLYVLLFTLSFVKLTFVQKSQFLASASADIVTTKADIEAAKKAVGIVSDNINSYFKLSKFLIEQDRSEEAVEYMPNLPYPYSCYEIVDLLIEVNTPEKAIELLQKALKLDLEEDCLDRLNKKLAILLINQGRSEEAINYLPNLPYFSCSAIADLLVKENTPEDTIILFKKALEINKGDKLCAIALKKLAILPIEQGRFEEFLNYLHYFTLWNCDELVESTDILIENNTPEDAIKLLKKVLEFKPGIIKGCLKKLNRKLAKLLIEQGRSEEALKYARSFRDDWHCEELVDLLIENNTPEDTIILLKKALEINKGGNFCAIALKKLAILLIEQGRFEEFLNCLHYITHWNCDHLLELADLLIDGNAPEDAITLLKKSSDLNLSINCSRYRVEASLNKKLTNLLWKQGHYSDYAKSYLNGLTMLGVADYLLITSIILITLSWSNFLYRWKTHGAAPAPAIGGAPPVAGPAIAAPPPPAPGVLHVVGGA